MTISTPGLLPLAEVQRRLGLVWIDDKRSSMEALRHGTTWLEAAQAAAADYHGPLTRRKYTQQRRHPLARRGDADRAAGRGEPDRAGEAQPPNG